MFGFGFFSEAFINENSGNPAAADNDNKKNDNEYRPIHDFLQRKEMQAKSHALFLKAGNYTFYKLQCQYLSSYNGEAAKSVFTPAAGLSAVDGQPAVQPASL